MCEDDTARKQADITCLTKHIQNTNNINGYVAADILAKDFIKI